jgi:hypothetical protein
MSENIENAELDELTVEELDLVAGGQQVSFNFGRIVFKYKEQKPD